MVADAPFRKSSLENIFLKLVVPGSYSIVGKPLCFHEGDLGLISHGGYPNRCPYILALLSQLNLSLFHCW